MSSTGRLENGIGRGAGTAYPEARGRRSVDFACDFHPLVQEISPAPDPAEAFERFATLPHVLFLDSAQHSRLLGRYSFLTADPFEWIISRGRQTFVSGEAKPRDNVDPFAILLERMQRWQMGPVAGLPPFQGGVAGVFGYDLCHHLERLPRPRIDDFEIPDLAVGFYDWVLAFDHEQHRAWIVSSGFPETNPDRRRRLAQKKIQEIRERLAGRRRPPCDRRNVDRSLLAPQHAVTIPGLTSNFT